METLFPAKMQVVRGEGILLEPRDFKKELWEFCQKHQQWEEKRGDEVLVEAELRIYYRRRTAGQNRLQWAICRRIKSLEGNEDISINEIHDGLKALHYPPRMNKFSGLEDTKDGDELTTVEYAKVVELFAMEAVKRGAKIRDIWILFTEWRWKQERDPLEGSYSSFEEYRELHPCCEACGVFLLKEGKGGEWIHAGEGAHIVGQDEGGPDDDWNRFIFCAKCHRGIQHGSGWEPLLALYPWCTPKCQKAWARCGKKDKSGDTDPAPATSVSGPTEGSEPASSDTRIEDQDAAGEIQGNFEVVEEETIEEKRDREWKETIARLNAIGDKSKPRAQESDQELDFDPNPSRHKHEETEEREIERRGEGVGAKDGTSPVEGNAEGEAGLESSAPLSDLDKAEQSKYGLF